MWNDRRGFLAAGLAGLATLLGPKSSLAGLFHRQGRARSRACAGSYPIAVSYRAPDVKPFYACYGGFGWSATPLPSFLPPTNVTLGVPCTIQVTGTGLCLELGFAQTAGYSPIVAISDQNNPSVTWGPFMNFNSTPADSTHMTFDATASGQVTMPNGSLTIAITMNGSSCAPSISKHTWMAVPVTYSQ